MLALDLDVELSAPDGARFKLNANQAPGSRPRHLNFRTKIGEGFSDASFQLARRIDRDYRDLGLVNDAVITGADGTVAYEGRVSAMPRDLDDAHTVNVTLAGWMAHAKDRKFREVFTGRSLGDWGEASVARRASLATSAGASTGDFSWSADSAGLICALPNQALGSLTVAEMLRRMPAGTKAAVLEYKGTTQSLPSGWIVRVVASDNEDMTSGDTYTPTLDSTLRTLTLTTPRSFIGIYVYSSGNAATPASGANVRFTHLATYGSHGLTLRAGESGEPDGVYASDALRDIAERFCPLLDPSGIVDTSYTIQQLEFAARTWPYDAFLELNKYHLWHLGVWEDKRLHFRPYDLSDYDWEIRTDDPGTTFSPQGASTEDFFGGMAVTYLDLITGAETDLTPASNPELADPSISNPWNQWGIPRWDEITLSTKTLAAQALQIGRAGLADRNRPKTPGTITVRGYIRDRAGALQPCWKVRAGQTIAITNFPNDSPRLIVETDYSDVDKTVKLAIDRPFAVLDAYLDRQANALSARGLG